jgi:hypothetical protein
VTIKVTKVSDDLYLAELTLPDLPNVTEAWSTTAPMSGNALARELVDRGCHQSDIGAAFYEQDPMWIEKLRGDYPPPSQGAKPFVG